MLNKVVVQSPAKINLHLKVHPTGDNGYHDIESIFQAIDFFDVLDITKTPEKIGCIVETTSQKLPIENTLTVAYREFCSYTGIKCGIHVRLDKQIFSGAGLGGGSSNGAALIQALDVLFQTKLSVDEKIQVASMVGSDVPFFIIGGAAIVTGRGEFVRQIKSRNDLYFVILMPDVHSSTKEAFCYFDEMYDKNEAPKSITLQEVEDVYRWEVKDWVFINSFTDLLKGRYPCIEKALCCLRDCGADYVQMSGSGAAVYGVFGSEEEAKSTYAKLSLEWTCRLARSYSI